MHIMCILSSIKGIHNSIRVRVIRNFSNGTNHKIFLPVDELLESNFMNYRSSEKNIIFP